VSCFYSVRWAGQNSYPHPIKTEMTPLGISPMELKMYDVIKRVNNLKKDKNSEEYNFFNKGGFVTGLKLFNRNI